MHPAPPASRLVVLSDLHLAPPGEQCVFAAHEPLVALIGQLAAVPRTDPPQWLVLNGDVFDFLQIPGYDALSLPLAPQRMTAILDALDTEPEAGNVVQALRAFTAAGHVLSCLPGNHDAELNLVTVQRVLAERLGSSDALPVSAGQWELHVAGRIVLGRHGHDADAFNAISGARMRAAQADGDDTVPMPPGSRLVCQVINPFRRAKDAAGVRRFPFIDRLPSEMAVVLAIMLLDPRLAGKRLKDALGIGAAALVRKALMAATPRGQALSAGAQEPGTGTDPAPATAASPTAAWVAELTGTVAEAIDASRADPGDRAGLAHLDHELDAFFAGQAAAGPGTAYALAGGDGVVRKLLWRALGGALEKARSRFQSAVPDDVAAPALAGWGHGVVALAGHTHAPKAIAGLEGGRYLNTGTWLDQVLPPTDTAPAALEGWLGRLRRDELPCWSPRSVAVVDAAGARLLRFDGEALVDWVDPDVAPETAVTSARP